MKFSHLDNSFSNSKHFLKIIALSRLNTLLVECALLMLHIVST